MIGGPQIPGIEGLEDFSTARMVLYQSGRLVHAPLLDVVMSIIDYIESSGLMLSGDEQSSGIDRLKLSGDESDYLLLSI